MKKIFGIILIFHVIIISCSSPKSVNQEISNEPFDSFRDKVKSGEWLYPKYNDEVQIIEMKDYYVFNYRYNNDNTNYKIKISSEYYSDFFPLFERGVLHYQLILGVREKRSVTIGVIKELSRDLDNPTKRRYELWRWFDKSLNACEYTFELFNENATIDTSTKDFNENATVIYSSNKCRLIM